MDPRLNKGNGGNSDPRGNGGNGNGASGGSAGNSEPSNGNGNGSTGQQAAATLTTTETVPGVLPAGRGRGKGNLNKERPETDSESGKRSTTDQTEPEDKLPKGDPSKRGRAREDIIVPEVFYTRPIDCTTKTGSSGQPINLLTNHFKLNFNTSIQVRQYRIDFLPEMDNVKIRRALIYQHQERLGAYIYDSGNLLYLMRPIDTNELISKSREGVVYKLVLKDSGNTIPFSTSMGLMVLNTILRRCMDGLKLQLVNRNLFDPHNNIRFPELKLELWPGYVTSIRQYEENVMICCEISHKVMRNETVLDILIHHTKDGGDYRQRFEKEILNTVVLTDYNNNTYSVVEVNWNMNPMSTFEGRNGQMTFVQYYKERYNINVRDSRQPLLVTRLSSRDIRGGRTTPALLIPELCRTTGLTDGMRANFQLMKQLGEFTRMNPKHRVDRLRGFAKRIRETKESCEVLQKFSCKMDPALAYVTGRVYDPETILFGNGRSEKPDARTADWTPALRNNSQYANEELKKWVLMYPKKTSGDTELFLKMMREVSNGLRFPMAEPKLIELADDRVSTYTTNLADICKRDPKLIMVVLMGSPQSNAERYGAIKKITCVNNQIPTQCIVQKTMQPKKGNMAGVRSIATKVMLQINCKLGGAPWMVNMPMSGVMVCGFDVSHNTASRSGASYGAFVATMDLKTSCKFYSSVAQHLNGVECAANIKIHMQKAIYEFKQNHGTLPARIIFYRDGVGDGQIKSVVETEVAQLRELLSSTYGGGEHMFKFAYVIVNKRINTRFFTENRNVFENPVPGTVVDNTVTLPERYDFYLVSQSVRQGTVSPTSYNIVYDSFGIPPDRQQMLAYKMCHLYYNWCGTTRVPCVVQYAHKLSLLVGEYIRQTPHLGLSSRLYYL